MSIYRLHKTQFVPVTVEKAWEFFSDPGNLKEITPPELGLEITSEVSGEIYDGMIITYNVNLLPYYKAQWVTEIKHVKPPCRFVDEQKIGPYKFWYHQHFFKESGNGTLVEDIIHYSVPYGHIGKLLNRLLIARNLNYIFKYRSEALSRIFPGGGDNGPVQPRSQI